MSYLHFLQKNIRLLAFGFFMAWFSSFGQTFFISLFGRAIRKEFGLSHGEFGLVYSAATLLSGLSLIWLGRKIDHLDLRVFSTLVCLGLIAACFLMAGAASVTLLFLALFALRLSGQGLMTHTSVVSMGRHFTSERGMALSIASLGHPVGEAAFPTMAVGLLSTVGWRGAWATIGTVLALILIPLTLWLLKDYDKRNAVYASPPSSSTRRNLTQRSYSAREVIRDPRFYVILAVVLAPPCIVSGFFFHQVHLAETKGWSLTWLASCFIGFAGATVISSLLVGRLIDRYGAVRLLPALLPPLGLALLALAVSDHPGIALVYLVLAGSTVGGGYTIGGAVWAELYGVTHLGAIRSMVAPLLVFSTALSPVGMGSLIDLGISVEIIALLSCLYIIAATALITAFSLAERPRTADDGYQQ